MQVQLTAVGTSPLLMHNPQLADPDNQFSKLISEITGKRKKTEEDRKEISRLEWYGGLYVVDGVVVLPTSHMRGALVECGKISKMGKMVQRGVHFAEPFVKLEHEGPEDIDALYADGNFIDRSVVGNMGNRIVRTRPIFNTWAVTADCELLTDVMDYDAFCRLWQMAGVVGGFGDNRVNGFGHFRGVVEKMAEAA